MPVKKNQFVQSLAEKWSVSKKQAGETLDSTLEELVKVLKSGADRKLNLSGFGVFKVVDRVQNGRTRPIGSCFTIACSAGCASEFC